MQFAGGFLLVLLLMAEASAQHIDTKVQVHTGYMPQFTVREASDRNVKPIGIRLMASNYDRMPVEFGFHAYANYGNVARASFGINFAYLFAERKAHHFKIGMSLSKIDLEDVINTEDLGPNIGDVHFTSIGNEFKPYMEWEWVFSRFSSLFVQAGYRIINAERSVVLDIEGEGLEGRVTERNETFFYSASGIEVGVGLSFIF